MGVAAGAAPTSIEVVAGVLRDADGRILLAQRQAGKHLAGTWEFPGGKREPRESAAEALARELDEELGIAVESARPWLSLTHRYPELCVRLRLFQVETWCGTPVGREGQPLRWVERREMDDLPMPDADRPIVKALELEGHYAITPDPDELGGTAPWLDWVDQSLQAGMRLFQLRTCSRSGARLRSLAVTFDQRVKACGGRWLLNGEADLARALGADGVHLTATRLHQLSARPLPADLWIAAECRDADELALAGALGLDFVTLSPVQNTSSRSETPALTWAGFSDLCAVSPLPVFAQGGMQPSDLERSRNCGGIGVAGIRGFGAAT